MSSNERALHLPIAISDLDRLKIKQTFQVFLESLYVLLPSLSLSFPRGSFLHALLLFHRNRFLRCGLTFFTPCSDSLIPLRGAVHLDALPSQDLVIWTNLSVSFPFLTKAARASFPAVHSMAI